MSIFLSFWDTEPHPPPPHSEPGLPILTKSGARHHPEKFRKTADVLHGEGPSYPIVDTNEVLRVLEETYLEEKGEAAFLVNVQETDLAGHAEDVEWYAKLLNTTDQWLAKFLPKMEEEDILIIMADHGNDPTIGHSNHTREYVPLMIAGHKVKAAHLGRRNSMADVGATLSEFFGLPPTEEGESCYKVILG